MIMRVVSALLLKLVLVASLSAFAQSTDNSLRLPHPSGAYGVGRVGYDWVDQSRAEAFAKDPSARREIMVYVWYPIDLGSGNLVRADYLPHADAIAKFEESSPTDGLEEAWGISWPRIFSHQVVTDTYERASIAGMKRFPVLIFAPGYSVPSTMYTTLIQDLVSCGYIIVSIEPTYDVAAVAFSDGRVIRFLPDPADPGRQQALPEENWNEFLVRIQRFGARHVEQWASDIHFVLNRLTALDQGGKEAALFAGRLDLHHVGVWGHSMGGMAAFRACQLDTRIAACLNADGGGPYGPFPGFQDSPLLIQPVMWIEIYHPPASDAQFAAHNISRKDWQKDAEARRQATQYRLQKCPGGSYHLFINALGTDHQSFSDYALLEFESKEDLARARKAQMYLEASISAFFDTYLRP
jgi:dienelactone hydrolase